MEHLDKSQLKALINAVEDPKVKLMIKVGYNHALRASEIVNLVGSNIRDGFLTIQRLKGSDKTVQRFKASEDPVFDEFTELVALSKELKSKDRLFPGWTRFNFGYAFRVACKRAGIPAHLAHPHVLKHSTAMAVIPAGIEYARQYLGHKNIASTGAYLKVSDEAATAKAFEYL
jgi:integrase